MAIAASEVRLFANITGSTGLEVIDGTMNNVFPDGFSNQAVDYRFVEVQNTNGSLTLSSVVAWIGVDAAGGLFSISVADGTARALSFAYSLPTASGLTYTTPTTQGTGLALPALATNTKCLLAIKRDLTGATAAYPEQNRLYVGGTSPI